MDLMVLSHHKHFTAIEVLAQTMLHELSGCRFLKDPAFTDAWSSKSRVNPVIYRRLVFRHPNNDLTAIYFERTQECNPWLATTATVRLNSEYYEVYRIHHPIPYWKPLNPSSEPEIYGHYFLPMADLSDEDPRGASATKVDTPHGRFVLDRGGTWHYTSRTLGTVLEAATDALQYRPGQALLWFNETFVPMLAGDASEDLCRRWEQWRALCQTEPRLLEYMKELRAS